MSNINGKLRLAENLEFSTEPHNQLLEKPLRPSTVAVISASKFF
ncbi:MAG: hypothetical protein OXE99_10895 [Cellvibrionales bacterium]|nr:hypothetical protein [Cellvibrionales bacterium]